MTQIDDITWICHVCKDLRPDNMIGVLSFDVTPVVTNPNKIRQNVRYCLDRADCIAEAGYVRFLPTVD